jgi:AAA15 family ATPase/GTPase
MKDMLISFTVANFRSFNEAETLSMLTSQNTDQNNSLGVNGVHVRCAAMIMGANSSGKSNLIDAVAIMQVLLNEGILIEDQDGDSEQERIRNIRIQRFRIGGRDKLYNPFYGNHNPTHFEMEFICFENKSHYHYVIKYDSEKICHESLRILNKSEQGKTIESTIFSRDFVRYIAENDKHQYEIKVPDHSMMFDREEDDLVVESVLKQYEILSAHNNSYLKTAVNNGCNKLRHCYDYLSKKMFILSDRIPVNIKAFPTRSNYYRRICNQQNQLFETKERLIDNKEGLLNLFKAIGADFDDIRYNDEKKSVEIDCKINNQSNWSAFNQTQSLGTNKFANLLPLIANVVADHGVIVIDELDKSLHNLLVIKILEFFNEHCENNAQIIFTAHDALLLDETLFKFDQINFIAKRPDKSSEIFKLSNFEGAESFTSIRQKYLAGKFGAIPEINHNVIASVVSLNLE